MATYVYCLVQDRRVPSSRGVPAGLDGMGSPRLLDAGGGLFAVVAEAPEGRYDAAAIERGLRDLDWVSRCALAHERVVESFLGSRATIPMKLFTLFRNDARALAHVRRRRTALATLVERVAGCYEWGLRILRDERRASTAPPRLAKASSGTAFLLRKHQAVLARQGAVVDARERADAAFATLAGAAAANRRKEEPGGELARSILLEAAFLVPVVRTKRFRALAERVARRLEDVGCDLTVSGPWPPYHFLD